MGRVRCPICHQSTSDESGVCDMCGNALPNADAIDAQTRARAGRALQQARAQEALKPQGEADPDSETMFVVRQVTGFTKVLIAWNTDTRWELKGGSGHVCYHAGEVGATAFDRGRREPGRPWKIELREIDGSPHGRLAFTFQRPWAMFFQRVDAFDGSGSAIGFVVQRFSLAGRRYDIRSAEGETLATIHGPLLSPWTFELRVNGEALGQIGKQWDGLGRELFTTADTFGVQLDPSWDPTMRGLVFAATFLIDFVHFERKQGALAAAIGADGIGTD